MQQVKAQHISSGSGYDIGQSCLFDGGSLSSSLGTSSAFTASFWVKRSEFGSAQKILGDTFGFLSDDTIVFNGTGTQSEYRDPSAWMHIVLAGTGMSNGYLYINGILHSDGWEGPITPASIGLSLKGYLSDFYFIDGQSLGPEMFALEDSDGVYNPIPYTGDYGTNGFYLTFDGSTTSFTNVGTHSYTVPAGVEELDVLVIGGGGSGSGGRTGINLGGGGAGGTAKEVLGHPVVPGSTINITVGAGATGWGGAGSSSIFDSITATGGGGAPDGNTGASNADHSGGVTSGLPGPGGAGAGQDGQGKEGGDGILSSITGLYYGGGGGGCDTNGEGQGGQGGGGNAYNRNGSPGVNGKGGGGGGCQSDKTPGRGGSGIIIVKPSNVDISFIGTDHSGNGNDFETTGITPDNIVADSPTNNYCTLNPINSSSSPTFSEGNLKADGTTWNARINTTFPVLPGKWYWEYECGATSTTNYLFAGATEQPSSMDDSPPGFAGTPGWSITGGNGKYQRRVNGTDTGGANYLYPVVGSIMTIAVDVDRQCVWFGRDGVWINAKDGSTSGDSEQILAEIQGTGTEWGFEHAQIGILDQVWAFATSISSVASSMTLNFGQRSFAYNPPEGYKALCTDNLPDPLVDPRENFSAVTYTGDGSAEQHQEVGLAPDFVWIKDRGADYPHNLWDTVRGPQKLLESNSIGPESTQTDMLNSFDTGGFTHGPQNAIGKSGNQYVSWNFKAGGPAVSNNEGSIPSEVSVNKDMGFSVVKYTGNSTEGSTVGHGLGAVPQIIIAKNLDISTGGGESWVVSIGNVNGVVGDFMTLNTSSPVNKGGGQFPVNPGNTVWTLGGAPNANANGSPNIAYCFANTEMIQAGQYTGTMNEDGPFVSLPFSPAFLMIKGDFDTLNWNMFDNYRPHQSNGDKGIAANLTPVDTYPGPIDFLSNGFKVRTGGGQLNHSTEFVYLAIAEQSFKNSRGR